MLSRCHCHAATVTLPRCHAATPQTRIGQKRKADEDDEDDDITAIPFDGQYGPEPPRETSDSIEGSSMNRVGKSSPIPSPSHQWEEEGAVVEGRGIGDTEAAAKRPRLVVRVPGHSG